MGPTVNENLAESSREGMFAAQVASLAVLALDGLGSKPKQVSVRRRYAALRREAALVGAESSLVRKGLGVLVVTPKTHMALARSLGECLLLLSDGMTERDRLRAGIDVVAFVGWAPEKHRLKVSAEDMGAVLSSLDHHLSGENIRVLQRAYKKHVARLTRASVAPGTKAAILVGSIAVSAVSAGAAAPALGAFIGTTFLGLSGAAATSAGLALLGGGSLASGGLGMAGGVLLIKLGAGGVYKGSFRAATLIARSSRQVFISQVAALHVSFRLSSPSAEANEAMISELRRLRGSLKLEEEILRNQQTRRGTSSDTGDASDSDDNSSGVGAERRRLTACVRVLDAEIKTLSKPSVLSVASKVPWGMARDLYDLIAT